MLFRSRSAVAMVDEPSFASWPSLMEGLLERVQNEAGMGSPADPPSHDAPRVGVDDEGYIDEPRQRRDVGEVREPQTIRRLGMEHSVDVIERTRGGLVLDCRSSRLAADDALETQ